MEDGGEVVYGGQVGGGGVGSFDRLVDGGVPRGSGAAGVRAERLFRFRC